MSKKEAIDNIAVEILEGIESIWDSGGAVRVKIKLFPMWKQISDAKSPDLRTAKRLLPLDHMYDYRDSALSVMIAYAEPWKISGAPSNTWFAATGANIAVLTERLRDMRETFMNNVITMSREYDELLAEAAIRLGDLYEREDYPATAEEFKNAFLWETEVCQLSEITSKTDARRVIPLSHMKRVFSDMQKNAAKARTKGDTESESVYEMFGL
jgi:hypothetical protein